MEKLNLNKFKDNKLEGLNGVNGGQMAQASPAGTDSEGGIHHADWYFGTHKVW